MESEPLPELLDACTFFKLIIVWAPQVVYFLNDGIFISTRINFLKFIY